MATTLGTHTLGSPLGPLFTHPADCGATTDAGQPCMDCTAVQFVCPRCGVHGFGDHCAQTDGGAPVALCFNCNGWVTGHFAGVDALHALLTGLGFEMRTREYAAQSAQWMLAVPGRPLLFVFLDPPQAGAGDGGRPVVTAAFYCADPFFTAPGDAPDLVERLAAALDAPYTADVDVVGGAS